MENGVQFTDELIGELSELCGILLEYWDIFGKKHITSVETKKAILSAMKLKINSAGEIFKETNVRKWKPWKTFIEPVHVISIKDQPVTVPVYIPIKKDEEAKLIISWSIEDENEQKAEFILAWNAITISEIQWIDGIRFIKINLSDEVCRAIGYYVIHVECKHPENIFPGGVNLLQKTSKVILTPDTCYLPPELQKGRTWGLSVNLYSICSARNWGVGDFTDLKKIAGWVADLKGGFIGINPLHAIPNTKPFGISPYSPVSRLYKNFIYLDVESIPEVAESEDIRAIMTSEDFNKELNKLRKENLVDYEKVATEKQNSCEVPESPNLRVSLLLDWQEWPEEYRKLSGKAVQIFKKANKKEVLFYKYIQWLIDNQIKEVSEEAIKHGMAVGLYHDLAIGSLGGGSDAWSYQDVIAREVDVGAPPDDFSPHGQNWGFPPLIPEKLEETGYELFIQTIRKNMKYGGALRIDHALGMFRLFWIPHGMFPKKGAYIIFPSEDLLRIIALESIRNRTIVIAEDLGTIGENVRETLQRFHMFSYRLFYFERNYPDPSFVPPDKYPDKALCALTTHDLPTIYGYWAEQDLEIKKQLGI